MLSALQGEISEDGAVVMLQCKIGAGAFIELESWPRNLKLPTDTLLRYWR